MTDKELIRRALLGSREAQQECTRQGIVLPCPICGEELRKRKIRKWTAAKDEPISRTVVEHKAKTGCPFDDLVFVKELDLAIWNTRPVPPIGRCGDCKFYTVLGHCKAHSQEPDQYGSGAYVEMLPYNFCIYFEPREE